MPRTDEAAFRNWYASVAKLQGLNPDPDAPEQFYDYRAAFRAGAKPDATGHWPSDFKKPGHPNMVVGGFNVQTGERVPGTPRAAEAELLRLGWNQAGARRLAATPEPDKVMSALRGAESIGAAPSPLWAILKKALTDPFGMGAGINKLNEKRKTLAKAILPDVVEEPLQQLADTAVAMPGMPMLGTTYAPIPRNLGDIDALKVRLRPSRGMGTKPPRTPMPETTAMIEKYVDRYPRTLSQVRRTVALNPAASGGPGGHGTGIQGSAGFAQETNELLQQLHRQRKLEDFEGILKQRKEPFLAINFAEDLEQASPVERGLVMAEEMDHIGQWMQKPLETLARQNAYTRYLDYDLNPLELRAKSAAVNRVAAGPTQVVPAGRRGNLVQRYNDRVDRIIEEMTQPPGRQTMLPVIALRELMRNPMGDIHKGRKFIDAMDNIAGTMASNPALSQEFDLMERLSKSRRPADRFLAEQMMQDFNARGGRFQAQMPGVQQLIQQILGMSRP